MTTTTEAQLPDGLTTEPWEAAENGQAFRIVGKQLQPGRPGVAVSLSAIQLPDGTVDNPLAFVEISADGLAPDEIRELAATLTRAADDLEGWVRDSRPQVT